MKRRKEVKKKKKKEWELACESDLIGLPAAVEEKEEEVLHGPSSAWKHLED